MNEAMALVDDFEAYGRNLPREQHTAVHYPTPVRTAWAATSVILSWILRLCSMPIPTVLFSSTTLKDISATGTDFLSHHHRLGSCCTVQQIDVRAEQSLFFPRQTRYLRRGSQSLVEHASRYIKSVPHLCCAVRLKPGSFYNTVWLILNDIIIGVAVGSFLQENSVYLAEMLTTHAEVRAISDAGREQDMTDRPSRSRSTRSDTH
jgi:hypothetical protein